MWGQQRFNEHHLAELPRLPHDMLGSYDRLLIGRCSVWTIRIAAARKHSNWLIIWLVITCARNLLSSSYNVHIQR